MEHEAFEELEASIREMKEIEAERRTRARETRLVDLDVSGIRAETGLTQEEFAIVLGIGTRALQEWEQGRRRPRGPARSLLLVAKHDPRAVVEGVRGGASGNVALLTALCRRKHQIRSCLGFDPTTGQAD